jgi:hypothetical protein
MPHLTEIARKNPEVSILGVGIWEEISLDKLKQFVAERGESVGYRLAYSGNQDGMAETWMKAAAQNGIPCTFLIKDGVIEWIGHPLFVDQPLRELKAGSFDRAASRKEFLERATIQYAEIKFRTEIREIRTLFTQGQESQARAKLRRLVANQPGLKAKSQLIEIEWAVAKKNAKAWSSVVREMLSSQSEFLKSAVLTSMTNLAMDGVFIEEVLSTASEIRRKSSEDFEALWNLSMVYSSDKVRKFSLGLECAELALKVFPKSKFSHLPEFRSYAESARIVALEGLKTSKPT